MSNLRDDCVSNAMPKRRTIDNAVILFSLLIAKGVVIKDRSYPDAIRKRLLERIDNLVKRYKNPEA